MKKHNFQLCLLILTILTLIYIYRRITTKPKYTVAATLVGGLGNNLFTIASVYAFARINKCNFAIYGDPQHNPHTKQNYNKTVFSKIKLITDTLEVKVIPEIYKNNNEELNKLLPINQDLAIHGLFQNFNHFHSYRQELKSLLSLPEVPRKKEYAQDFFIHVRMGDFLSSSIHNINLDIYYTNAYKKLEEILGYKPVLVLYSDNIPDAINYLNKLGIPSKERTRGDELTEFSELMCYKGGIHGHSTFAWWAGYLNDAKNKTIIIPNIYLNENHNFSGFYYDGAIIRNTSYPITRKIYFLSFGGPTQAYHEALKRIGRQANNFGIFYELVLIKDTDLDREFWNKHRRFVKSNSRGFGYWIWKSYINLKLINRINDNDIVVYADSGCEMNYLDSNKMTEYLNYVEEHDLLSFQLHYVEKEWTKMDLFERLKNKYNCSKDILESGQLHATSFIYKKTPQITNMIREWYDICSDYHMIDDSPSIIPNDPIFREHRHDQSIFSLLRKINNIGKVINDESVAILMNRNRTGISKLGL